MIYDQATTADIPQIKSLYQELTQRIHELEPDFFKETQQSNSFFEEMILSENSDILTVKNGNNLVGLAIIQLQETPDYPIFEKHTFCYCLDLVVTKDHRTQGIASNLLSQIEEWAYQKNAEYIELSVLNKNKNAFNLYQSAGFLEKMTTLYKKVDKKQENHYENLESKCLIE